MGDHAANSVILLNQLLQSERACSEQVEADCLCLCLVGERTEDSRDYQQWRMFQSQGCSHRLQQPQRVTAVQQRHRQAVSQNLSITVGFPVRVDQLVLSFKAFVQTEEFPGFEPDFYLSLCDAQLGGELGQTSGTGLICFCHFIKF